MVADIKTWVPEGESIFTGGVNSGMDPDILAQGQLAWAKNMSMRGGKLITRGGLIERTKLPGGRVQGIEYFSVGRGVLVVAINGFYYIVDVEGDTFTSQQIPTPAQRSNEIPQVFMTETSGFMVTQDGQSKAMIFDGSTFRDALADEVPIGRQMAFGNGRLWVARGGGRVEAGDIVGTSTGSELKFTENVYLLGGGSFVMPSSITGMAFVPTNDRATGFGVLLVFGKQFTVALRADIPDRAQWSIVDGFQSTLFPDIGCTGHTTITSVNQDLFWRDGEAGMRSLKQAIADYQTPGSAPLSREISRLTDHESADILESSHVNYFDNRLIAGSSPFFVDEDIIAFKDLAVMDFTQLASLRGKSLPLWEGEWEGFNSTHAVRFVHEGKERMIFISHDSDCNNRLWEYVPRKRNDESFDLSVPPVVIKTEIEQEAEFKKINWGNITKLKKIARFDLWFSDVERVDITLYFRRENDLQWNLWETKTICFELDNPGPDFKQLRPGFKSQLKSFTPPEDDTITGTEFQFKLRLKGHIKIDKVVAWAEILEDVIYAVEEDEDPACVENIIIPVELNYEIPIANVAVNNYVDEIADNYVDENGDQYVG